MKRKDLLSKIKREALKLDPALVAGPVRANDLLKYDGEEFVDVLYRRVLQREPDPAGKEHYLSLTEKLPKPLLIYFFSRSEEAIQNGVDIIGLHSALLRFYLKIPSALMKILFAVTKRVFYRVTSLLYMHFHKAAEEIETDYSRFYLLFEEKFRGPEEEIEQGLKVYLPLLQGINGSLIDLGSGRGEWLRLLRKEGFSAKGVEINPYFLENCRKEGLEVIRDDAFKFLRNAGNSSIGAITAFHLIEHLDPRKRLFFFKEIYRVLKPGGTLILETPNARNIFVSAGDFWRDPDHITPVFPDSLSFMGKFAGFSEVTGYFFNRSRTALVPSSDVNFEKLKDYMEISRDFALFARKP